MKTDRLLDPNANIELLIQFPGSSKEHKVIGRVKRLVVMSDPEKEGGQIYGVGIGFVRTQREVLTKIDDLFKKLKEAKD